MRRLNFLRTLGALGSSQIILSWQISTIICAWARCDVAIAWSDAAFARSQSSRIFRRDSLALHIGEFIALFASIIRCCGFCFSRGVAAAMASAFVWSSRLFPTFRSCHNAFSCCLIQSLNFASARSNLTLNLSSLLGIGGSGAAMALNSHRAICIMMLMLSSGRKLGSARKMLDVHTLRAKASHRLIPSVASVFRILMIAAKTSTWSRLPLATKPPPMSRLVLRIFCQRFLVDSLFAVAEWMAGNFSVGARKGRVHAVENTPSSATTRQTAPSPMIRDDVARPLKPTIAASSGPLIV
mmetsp:Transcript_7470/g.22171  ORF Transcript_7470/g.22171 Transcript_7470/m.22171 type:complete len:297 (-) Transcript_7470:1641-2531(-)